MSLYNQINDPNKVIHFGVRSDVCALCLREAVNKDKRSSIAVRNELMGKLEGRRVVRVRHNGTDIVVCQEHIEKIYQELRGETSEQAEDPS